MTLWDLETNTHETRDHYPMRPRPRPITVRPRLRPRPKKWSRDHACLETLTSLSWSGLLKSSQGVWEAL